MTLTLDTLKARFRAESQHGASRGLRAIASYGLSLVHLTESLSFVTLWSEFDSGHASTIETLNQRMLHVYSLILEEIRNGYPTTEADLVSKAVTGTSNQNGDA